MKEKSKTLEKLGLRSYLGTTGMAACDGITSALMTSWFMVYLTDYAGIGTYAAILGSIVLVLARVFDAVNDPLEGMIINRAKASKIGKYKPFIFLSIFMTAIGVSCLFFIPKDVATNPVLVTIWIILFYLIYDVGYSFYTPNLLLRTLTLDDGQRGKLMIGPRVLGIAMGMISSSIVNIATSVNENFNNMHISFGLTVLAFVGGFALVSLLGTSVLKEKYHSASEEEGNNVTLKDFFLVFKGNKAMQSHILSSVFSGFIWNFLFATMLYYIKWGLCTDITTGVVDQDLYGTMSMVASLLMLFPLILGTLIANPLMKLFKSAVRLRKVLLIVESVASGTMFVLHLLGILNEAPMLFLVCAGITTFALGICYIPDAIIEIECMDYETYLNGKDRSGVMYSFGKFLGKAQGALATAVIGFLLVAIGYVVDSETDQFIGDLAAIPDMISGFVIICSLVPCVLGILAWLCLLRYPIDDKVRADMKKKQIETE